MAEEIPTPEGLNIASLAETNDPIPQPRKSLLMQVYQSHPLLKAMLDKASDKQVGEYVFGFDTARGPDHAAVTVFEKQPDGSLTMVASETPDRETYERVMERVNTHQTAVEFNDSASDREESWQARRIWWPDELPIPLFDGPIGARKLGYPFDNVKLVIQQRERIAILETEIEALRVEKRALEGRGLRLSSEYPRAHDFGVPVRIYNNVRSTDLNVPSQTRSAAEMMAQPSGDGAGGLRAMMDDPPTPTDEVHQAVERVIGHIADGKVTPTGRQALRGALDKAETPPTGRAKSDAAIGRIASLR